MIEHLLHPLVCERFINDEKYRNGHLRVINALPGRRVLGLHTPQIKMVAKSLFLENGDETIYNFENRDHSQLCYEETLIWGYLINLQKCSIDERLKMVDKYIPILDNWAVCDSFCANAKWMERANKEELWLYLEKWFNSKREFEVRFAIVSAMTYFLKEEWLKRLFSKIDSIDFNKIESHYNKGRAPYYVRMGVAWLLASSLAKFPQATKEYVRACRLPEDVKKLYIRKAKESFRTRNFDSFL